MSVKIGKTYFIKVSAPDLMELVPSHSASNELRANYPFMIDLVNKPVVCTSIHKGYGSPGDPWYTEDVAVVHLADHPTSFWLHIKAKYLYTKISLDRCTCELKALMCGGCKCGAIKQERKA